MEPETCGQLQTVHTLTTHLMKKSIIAIFVPSYQIGGAEKVLVQLANSLLAHFDEVHMLSNTLDGPLKEQLDPSIRRIHFGNNSYKRVFFDLISYYNEFKPDVVITSLYATGIVACAACQLSRHKPVLLIGAHNSFSAKLAAPDNIKDKYLLKPLSRLLFHRADAVVSVSRGVSDDLALTLSLPSAKLHVIYNPVVSPDLIQKSLEPLEHRWLGDRNQRIYKTILSVGRLVEQKGYDILLEAFSSLPNRDGYRLVIVGDGPLAKPLFAKAKALGIEESVDFVGYDLNPYRYMSRADIFVLSSKWEGLPTVLIEAMACGCSIVATDCPYGPNEILENGKYGALVPVADAQALTNSILETLNGKSGLVSLTDLKCRANDFTDLRATDAYVELIKRLIDKPATVV